MARHAEPGERNRLPIRSTRRVSWGSDVPAQMLRRLGIPFIALTPGASYRGFHDSLVNHLGNERPEMLLCLHEEHAVAIAHGYAKVTGRAMAVALHSNVGLMHGSMAIFNAWGDRAPMLILGATGPVDAAQRRPWIDWLHTTQDQGALIRHFTKWDDQPGSAAAATEAMARGWKLTNSAPKAPVYINLDAGWQEAPVEGEIAWPDPERHASPAPTRPDPTLVAEAAARLAAAKSPVILFGRGTQDGGGDGDPRGAGRAQRCGDAVGPQGGDDGPLRPSQPRRPADQQALRSGARGPDPRRR